MLSKSSNGDENERQKKSDFRLVSVNDESKPVEDHQEGAGGEKGTHNVTGSKKDVGTGSGYQDNQEDHLGDRTKEEVTAKHPTNSADQT